MSDEDLQTVYRSIRHQQGHDDESTSDNSSDRPIGDAPSMRR